jgi:hypothetical protein
MIETRPTMTPSTTKFQEVYFHGRVLPQAIVKCFEHAPIGALLTQHGVSMLDANNKPALLTGSYLSADDLANPDIASNVAATERIMAKVAWFCENEDGDLFGYWLGETAQLAALPILVKYDTEGQFDCKGAIGLGDLFAAECCSAEDDKYLELAQQCAAAGLQVTLKTLSNYYEVERSVDPNALRNADYYAERVKRGLSGAE